MKKYLFMATISLLFLWSRILTAADNAEFTFNVKVLANTCEIAVEGTAANIVDFGSVPLEKFKSDAAAGNIKKEFIVKLVRCRNNNFTKNKILISGNYINDGYLDSPGSKNFAVRISDKNNATQSQNVFFTNVNNTMWTGFTSATATKTFTAYLMCRNGIADCSASAENVGNFKATVTLTYMVD
ncbi:fimbrial protein [Morganella psychrotolerans]|uniref:fimbrial protein n=1 Tax=Morganella psychrotolerans TaxID=368603 RepID=UPI0039B003AF